MSRKILIKTLGAACALGIMGSANAYTCADYFVAGTYGVDGNQDGMLNAPGYACNLGTDSNTPDDVEDALQVALGNDWFRLDKTDDNAIYNGNWPNPLTMTPNTGANEGTWELADGIWDAFDRLVLVIKDGSFDPNGKDQDPGEIKWIWYEITKDDYMGDWFLGEVIDCNAKAPKEEKASKGGSTKKVSTAAVDPSEEEGGSCLKNISHGELFGYGDGEDDDGPGDDDVPEPGTLALLGLGLLGLGASRRRRSTI
jgi:hypothetical protein